MNVSTMAFHDFVLLGKVVMSRGGHARRGNLPRLSRRAPHIQFPVLYWDFFLPILLYNERMQPVAFFDIDGTDRKSVV